MIIPISYVSVLFLIQVYEYSKQLTSMGCLYLAFADIPSRKQMEKEFSGAGGIFYPFTRDLGEQIIQLRH